MLPVCADFATKITNKIKIYGQKYDIFSFFHRFFTQFQPQRHNLPTCLPAYNSPCRNMSALPQDMIQFYATCTMPDEYLIRLTHPEGLRSVRTQIFHHVTSKIRHKHNPLIINALTKRKYKTHNFITPNTTFCLAKHNLLRSNNYPFAP